MLSQRALLSLSQQRGSLVSLSPLLSKKGVGILRTSSPVLFQSSSSPRPKIDSPSPFFSPTSELSPVMDFSDFKKAYKTKTTMEILRSIMVLKLCQSKTLVDSSDKLLKISEKVLGKKLTHFFLNKTFFKHFCAGEDRESIQPTIKSLNQNYVRCILDYAAEADVTESKDDRSKEREGVVSARLYDYHGEEECDKNCEIFLTCMEAAAEQNDGFVAIKLTALCRPVLLEKMTTLLLTFREIWTAHVAHVKGKTFHAEVYEPGMGTVISGGAHEEVDAQIAHYGDMTKDVRLSREDFTAAMKRMNIQLEDEEYENIFERFDQSGKNEIDYIEWNQGLDLDYLLTETEATLSLRSDWADSTLSKKATKQLVTQLTALGYLPVLNESESIQYLSFEKRLNKIAEEAARKKIRLLVDAEQTYLQTAIDHVTRQLQVKHNKEFPLIFNTYQCYLNWSRGRLERDIERAKRNGYWFAAKLVRGAYMVQERERAHMMGYPSPIMRSKTEVDYNYNACIEVILQNASRSNVMIASHNQYSIELAVGLMQKYEIKASEKVFFAQLLGMADNITNALGLSGYQSYKYLPYGRISLVVPYLIRRAQENSGIMTTGSQESVLLRRELWRRMFSSFLFWRK